MRSAFLTLICRPLIDHFGARGYAATGSSPSRLPSMGHQSLKDYPNAPELRMTEFKK